MMGDHLCAYGPELWPLCGVLKVLSYCVLVSADGKPVKNVLIIASHFLLWLEGN